MLIFGHKAIKLLIYLGKRGEIFHPLVDAHWLNGWVGTLAQRKRMRDVPSNPLIESCWESHVMFTSHINGWFIV